MQHRLVRIGESGDAGEPQRRHGGVEAISHGDAGAGGQPASPAFGERPAHAKQTHRPHGRGDREPDAGGFDQQQRERHERSSKRRRPRRLTSAGPSEAWVVVGGASARVRSPKASPRRAPGGVGCSGAGLGLRASGGPSRRRDLNRQAGRRARMVSAKRQEQTLADSPIADVAPTPWRRLPTRRGEMAHCLRSRRAPPAADGSH